MAPRISPPHPILVVCTYLFLGPFVWGPVYAILEFGLHADFSTYVYAAGFSALGWLFMLAFGQIAITVLSTTMAALGLWLGMRLFAQRWPWVTEARVRWVVAVCALGFLCSLVAWLLALAVMPAEAIKALIDFTAAVSTTGGVLALGVAVCSQRRSNPPVNADARDVPANASDDAARAGYRAR